MRFRPFLAIGFVIHHDQFAILLIPEIDLAPQNDSFDRKQKIEFMFDAGGMVGHRKTAAQVPGPQMNLLVPPARILCTSDPTDSAPVPGSSGSYNADVFAQEVLPWTVGE